MFHFYRENIAKLLICSVLVFTLINDTSAYTTNLSCYQCETHNEEDCDLRDLKPCASIYDRCAIHYTKNSQKGLIVKRTCGLAPCSFGDDFMAEKGLGMDCDRSKDSYSCVVCCKENGCNRNRDCSNSKTASNSLVLFCLLILFILNIASDFIPPYVSENRRF